MYEFIRLQYQFFHTLTKQQVLSFAPKFITAEQAVEIITNAVSGVE